MPIVRGPRLTDSFTILSNAVLRDERLSYRARGVLAAILSYPDDWRTDSVTLARHGKEGREAVRTALNELEEHGYLRREKRQDKNGKWFVEFVVYESPHKDAGQTEDGFPGVGLPGVGLPGAIRSTDTKDLEEVSGVNRLDPCGSRDEDQQSPPYSPEKDNESGFKDWRSTDLELFRDLVEETHIHSDGTGPWGRGEWPVDVWYRAFLKRPGKEMHWPGRYLSSLADRSGLEGYLSYMGLEPYTPHS